MSIQSAARLLFTMAVAPALYFVILLCYRLYFHPLKQFPGPRLAAATRFYEFYFSVLKGGKFHLEIERLHSIYG
jgi:hypothetical protein